MTIDVNDNQLTNNNYLAALDIGSNSIHFVYAREIDNHLQVLHTEKYPVALAAGLTEDNILTEEAMDRALEVLSLLRETVTSFSDTNFRAVATYTLRQAKNADAFLAKAAKVFPFDIEIISGHEEARLIYQGVAHYHQQDGKKLVLDIGGGSTECVIGEEFNTHVLASLNMGCVSYSTTFFPEGNISSQGFDKAILSAKIKLESIVNVSNTVVGKVQLVLQARSKR